MATRKHTLTDYPAFETAVQWLYTLLKQSVPIFTYKNKVYADIVFFLNHKAMSEAFRYELMP